MPSRSSPQLLRATSFTWAHDVQFHIAGTNEPKMFNKPSSCWKAHCAHCCFHDYIYIYYIYLYIYIEREREKKIVEITTLNYQESSSYRY